jgi:hypothetical protein
MREVTWNDFADSVGTVYRVELGERHVELTLDRAAEIPSGGRPGGSFRLEFLGPRDAVLPQAIYPFRHGDELLEIFIVPIGRDQDGTRYEAIFN